RQVLRFHKALLLQALGESGRIEGVALSRGGVQESDQRQLPCLTGGARRREDRAEKAGESSSPDGHVTRYRFGLGSVERSETHRRPSHAVQLMGFASLNPSYTVTTAHRTNARP